MIRSTRATRATSPDGASRLTRVLVVDDEPAITRTLVVSLGARGYDVQAAGTGTEALAAATERPPDVILLDLGLPDLDGMDILALVRGWSAAHIIVLSGRGDATDKIAALDAGADDYVTKPFSMSELVARIHVAERRGTTRDDSCITLTDRTVDFAARTVTDTRTGEPVRLTPTEWRLVDALVRHPGRLVTQPHLLTEVWDESLAGESHHLRVHMANLRRKLELDPSRPRHFVTEPGTGYRFVP